MFPTRLARFVRLRSTVPGVSPWGLAFVISLCLLHPYFSEAAVHGPEDEEFYGGQSGELCKDNGKL